MAPKRAQGQRGRGQGLEGICRGDSRGKSKAKAQSKAKAKPEAATKARSSSGPSGRGRDGGRRGRGCGRGARSRSRSRSPVTLDEAWRIKFIDEELMRIPAWREHLFRAGVPCGAVGSPTGPTVGNGFAQLLQCTQPQLYMRLQAYMAMRADMIKSGKLSRSDSFFCNLEQRADGKPTCGKDLGCLTTSGDWWSVRKQRFMIGFEWFVAQGVAPFPPGSCGLGDWDWNLSPFDIADVLHGMKDTRSNFHVS